MTYPSFSEELTDDRVEQDHQWESLQDPDWGPDETTASKTNDD